MCPTWISEINPGYSGSERIASQRYSVGGVILHGSFELDRKQLMIKRCDRGKRVICKICGLQRCTDAPPAFKNQDKDCRSTWWQVGKNKRLGLGVW